MDSNFLAISGWIIALLSLVVNFLQLQNNKSLKKKLTTSSLNVGENSTGTQQTHSGEGHNVNSGGNVDIK